MINFLIIQSIVDQNSTYMGMFLKLKLGVIL